MSFRKAKSKEKKLFAMLAGDVFTSCPGFEHKIDNILTSWRGSKKLVVVIVAVALLLDNMLLTAVGKFNF